MSINTNNKYEGYIWMSDRQIPIVLNGEEIPEGIIYSKNPFVIEAELFDRANQKSYSIRNIDGVTKTKEFDVEVEDEKLVGCTEYISHRIKGHNRLRFIQRWTEEPDNDDLYLCEGMPTLVPAERVFIGFEN